MPDAAYTASVPVGTYILVLEFVLVACVLLLAFYMVRDSEEDHRLVRLYLKFNLAHTRLNRMLTRHRIGVEQYFANVPVPKIKHQLHECRACPRKRLCDAAAATDQPKSLDQGYCPNLAEIKRFMRATPMYA